MQCLSIFKSLITHLLFRARSRAVLLAGDPRRRLSDVTWVRHDADGASDRSYYLLVSDDGYYKQETSKVSTW